MGVYIVDDDEGTRQSLAFLLRKQGIPTQSFSSPVSLLQTWDDSTASCLVVDFAMPDMSGLQLIREIRNRGSTVPFLLLTGHGTIPMTVEAMRLGAVTVLEKPFDPTQFIACVTSINQALREKKSPEVESDPSLQAKFDSLTTRERQVMELVVDGDLSKQIAKKLGISSKTVEVHRSNITKKMGVQSVAQLVRMVVSGRMNRSLLSK